MNFLFLFSVFLSMLKIDHPPHQFYNFAIREMSLEISNIGYVRKEISAVLQNYENFYLIF